MSAPSSTKLLKKAKKALSEDPSEAISLAQKALKIDPSSTNAHLLIGKACILNNDSNGAESAFKKCIAIDNSNITAWKGYCVLVKQYDDYKKFFEVSSNLCGVLVAAGEDLSGLIEDIKLYVKKFGSTDNEFLECYYAFLLPGTVVGETCGAQILDPTEALENLLRLKQRDENQKIKNETSKIAIKFNKTEAAVKIAQFKYSVFSRSSVIDLYDNLINITLDDEKRRVLEEEALKYRVAFLEVVPESEPALKDALKKHVLEIVNGMVLVKHSSFFAWNLFFDINDFKEVSDIDVDILISFITLFRSEGLASVLYGYCLSDISPFSKDTITKIYKEVSEKTKKKSSKKSKRNTKPASEIENNEVKTLSSEEVLDLLTTGSEKSKNSILSYRILVLFYLHLQEYASALKACNSGISLFFQKKTLLGLDLSNTHTMLVLKLAYIFTYFEAPKNFSSALSLYNSIISKDPDNFDAKIGKGLVFIQEGKLEEARVLLQDAVDKSPDNNDALLELSWCQVQLGEIDTGRSGLEAGFKKIEGSHLGAYQKRCTILWRIAQSYILEVERADEVDSEIVQKAFDKLVESLKINKNHAPSYTSLGTIYTKYLDNETKALKFFFRAFELDESEIVAARYLVEDFCNKAEWETAEVLCERMVTSEKVRRKLMTLDHDKSWPYRVLGVAALESQKGDKAVEWFQSAIRLHVNDVESWVGLGEAYLFFGRFESAIKVFNKSITIKPDHWQARYLLGVSQALIKENEGSIVTLEKLLEEKPDEECVLIALYESLISLASDHMLGGFYGRATDNCNRALDLLVASSKVNNSSQKLWKSLADVVRIFLSIQSKIGEFPFDTILELLENVKYESNDDFLSVIDGIDGISKEYIVSLKEEGKYHEFLCGVLTMAFKIAIGSFDVKAARSLRAVCWFNLGLAHLECFVQTEKFSYRDAGIESFKKALQLDSSNVGCWIALGNAMVSVNPRISQHCFIKASILDTKNGEVWSNLAVLYLKYGDYELAQQTFLKAQSISPNLSNSWIGDALMAKESGDNATASRLFSHGLAISNGRSAIAQLLYGISVCENTREQSGEAAQTVSMANFAMSKYLKQRPQDDLGLEVACHICERASDYVTGREYAAKLCDILEAKYEESESDEVLIKFATAKSQLAGFELGLEEYEACIENAQFAIDILSDDDDSIKCMIYSRTVLGLAYYSLDEFGQSLEEFKLVLEASKSDSTFVILIVQALYNYNDPDTKQAAMDELLEAVANNEKNLSILFTLAAIALAENDSEIISVVKDELEGLSLEELSSDVLHRVPSMINYISKRLGVEGSSDRYWRRSAMLFPNSHIIWQHLDAKVAAKIGASGQTSVTADQLAKLCTGTGEMRMIQRGLLLSPQVEGFKKLKGCF